MKNTLLITAIRSALGVVAATSMLPNTVFAQEEVVLEEMVVTGSRIKRANSVSTTPVESISLEKAIQVGRFSIADTLRASTANSFGSVVPSSGSSAQSQATVDLLGLGSERTLVLLDGKRLPGSPSLGGSSVNINQIPLAMVENIEVLKGGSSAIYGSDAVAGVVNIQLKENFEGFEFSVNQQDPEAKGGEASDFSFVTGISSDKGNITFAYEHAEQTPIFDRDRPYTAPSFVDTDGNGVFDQTVGVSVFGASIRDPDTLLYQASPVCDDLVNTVDGFVGAIELTPGSNESYCGFAFAGVSANQASTNRDSIFVNSTYEINDNVSFFARVFATSNDSFGRYAPPAATYPSIPVESEHNPFDEEVSGLFRWYQIGNRDGLVSDYSQDYIAGLEGQLLGGNVDYEIYYHHNTTDNKSVGEFYLSFAGLEYNLTQGIDLASEEGVANMSATTLTQDRTRFDQFYAGAGFSLGKFEGGDIQHYVGAESFNVEYDSIVDAQSEAGLIGGSSGNTSGDERDNWAVFYEALVPVTDKFDVNLAVRYDDYSDFGSKVSPQVAATYSPNEALLLRASWGKGFRAPSLQALSQADSFAADFATDYVTCAAEGVGAADCPEQQYNTYRLKNENLTAETSTSINLGAVYDTGSFSASIDYFSIDIKDAIRFVPIQDIILAEFIGADNPDPSIISVDRVTNGSSLPEFTTGTINGPGLEVSGLSASLDYILATESVGMFNFSAESTYFIEYLEDNYAGGPFQDKTGWELQPEYKLQFTTIWSMGDHSFAWNMDYTPGTSSFETPNAADLTSGILLTNGKNDDYLIHNVTYTYEAGIFGQYRLGLRNLTDEDPVLSNEETYADGYDALYSAGHIGRLVSLGATWKF